MILSFHHPVLLLRFFGFLGLFAAIPSLASLEFETTSKSFKCHPLQASETLEFNFTNTGSAPVTILELKPGCGCTSGKVDKKTYAPGEAGRIHLTFDLSKRLGAQRKGIAVLTDGSPKKGIPLYISTTIPKTYAPSVRRLTWASGEERTPKSCILRSEHKNPFPLEKAVALREGIKVDLKPIRAGYEYELTVKPDPGLEGVLIPIKIHPQKPEGMGQVRLFTIYALVK